MSDDPFALHLSRHPRSLEVSKPRRSKLSWWHVVSGRILTERIHQHHMLHQGVSGSENTCCTAFSQTISIHKTFHQCWEQTGHTFSMTSEKLLSYFFGMNITARDCFLGAWRRQNSSRPDNAQRSSFCV